MCFPHVEVLAYFEFSNDKICRVEYKQNFGSAGGGFLVPPIHQNKPDAVVRALYSEVRELFGSDQIHYFVVGERTTTLLQQLSVHVVDLAPLGCPGLDTLPNHSRLNAM